MLMNLKTQVQEDKWLDVFLGRISLSNYVKVMNAKMALHDV